MAYYSLTLDDTFDRTGSISPIASLTVTEDGDDVKYDASIQDPYNNGSGDNVVQISTGGLSNPYTLPGSFTAGWNTDDGRQEKTYGVTDIQPA